MALGGVSVEQRFGRPSFDGRGEFPSEIDGVADAEIEPLASEGRMDVRGVAGEQNSSLPVVARLTGVVGPTGGGVDRGDGHVGFGDISEALLEGFDRDGGFAIGRRAVELDGEDSSGHRAVDVGAFGGSVPARREFLRISDRDHCVVAGDLWISAREIEASEFAHGAAASVAAYEPTRAEGFAVGLDGDAIGIGCEIGEWGSALDLDA